MKVEGKKSQIKENHESSKNYKMIKHILENFIFMSYVA